MNIHNDPDDIEYLSFTSDHMQLVLMRLNPKEEIGNEIHESNVYDLRAAKSSKRRCPSDTRRG
jgi:hypothetical protein